MSALWYAAPRRIFFFFSLPVSQRGVKHEGSQVQDENTTSAPDSSHFKRQCFCLIIFFRPPSIAWQPFPIKPDD